jgi:hypothetical protein
LHPLPDRRQQRTVLREHEPELPVLRQSGEQVRPADRGRIRLADEFPNAP